MGDLSGLSHRVDLLNFLPQLRQHLRRGALRVGHQPLNIVRARQHAGLDRKT